MITAQVYREISMTDALETREAMVASLQSVELLKGLEKEQVSASLGFPWPPLYIWASPFHPSLVASPHPPLTALPSIPWPRLLILPWPRGHRLVRGASLRLPSDCHLIAMRVPSIGSSTASPTLSRSFTSMSTRRSSAAARWGPPSTSFSRAPSTRWERTACSWPARAAATTLGSAGDDH